MRTIRIRSTVDAGSVSVTGGEVWWDISLIDGVAADDKDTARMMLDEFYSLPDTSPAALPA